MSLDWSILQWIQENLKCGFLDGAMPVVTALGNGGGVWLAAAGALICTKKYRKSGFILLAGLAAGALLGNLCLKPLIARPRPCWLDTSAELLIAAPTDYSFPSGHALSSTIAATVLTLTSRRLATAAIPLAVLIAFSRLYLYVHFPSDILGGVLLGLVIGIAVFFVGNVMQTGKSPLRE